MSQSAPSPLKPGGKGRCGMCAACGSMPPWAPEALQDASPDTRRAIFERMEERQRVFIEERDAKLAATKNDHHLTENPAKSDQVPQMTLADHGEHPALQDDTQSLDTLPPADKIPLHAEELKAAYNPLDDALESEMDANPDMSKTSDDLDFNGAAVVMSPPSPAPRSILTGSANSPSPRRSSMRRAVVIDPNPERTAQRESNPNVSAMSFRSNDSDVDSFHTAEEVEHDVQDKSDLEMVEVAIDDPKPPDKFAVQRNKDSSLDFTDWQAFQQETTPGSNESEENPDFTASPLNGEQAAMEDAVQTDTTNVSKEGSAASSSGAIPTMSMLQLSPGDSLSSVPSENLEEAVAARRQPARGHSRQSSVTQFEEYPLPSDIVPLQSADTETPLHCHDCERWRSRVEELQTKVEALTAALAARDMECASLRAKHAGKLREPNKAESRLIQECNSLRVTTEFLYRKLERYERSAQVGAGDVH